MDEFNHSPGTYLAVGLLLCAAGGWLINVGAAAFALLGVFFVGLGLSLIAKGWKAREVVRERERILEEANEPSGVYGTAQWASESDVQSAGMFEPGGLLLGWNERFLYHNGEAGHLVIAPPGAGKTTCFTIPNGLIYERGSVFTDPRGEVAAVVGRHREQMMGHTVHYLNPHGVLGLPDSGFDPLCLLSRGPDLKDNAALIASLLLPGHARSNAGDDFFLRSGRTLLCGGLLWMVAGRWPGGCSLAQLNNLLRQMPEELKAIFRAMAVCPDLNGLLRRYGGEALTTLETAPRQFMGGLSMALQATELYDENSPIGRSTSRGRFHPRDLKNGNTDLFVILPGRFVETQGAWTNLVMSLCMEMVGRSERSDRVTFFLEEFANLGFMPGVRKAMAQYRAQGLQVVIIAQGFDQLKRIYGPEAVAEFISLVDGVQMFGVRDPQTLDLVAGWMGQYTAKTYSQNVRPEMTLYPDVGQGISETGVPLMRKEMIRQMSGDRQIIFYRNLPPIWAQKVDYRAHKDLRRLAAPNPYYAQAPQKKGA